MRSLRTLHLRIPRQSQTAAALAEWLDRVSKTVPGEEFDGVPGGVVQKVWHSSLQAKIADWDVAKQMEGGWNATFSFLVCFACTLFGVFNESCYAIGFGEGARGYITSLCQVFRRKQILLFASV